jgi:two-component system alkaline phosphatase synthesis response regulator PhoP
MNENKYKILLVDDEEDILEFLGYNLAKEGYQVKKASDGSQGLEIAKAFNPHLILLDVMMPGMDGVETCEEIRKNKNLDKTVIAFLTARSEDYSQVAGFDAGGDDYIVKPIKPKVLVSRIKALLKRYGRGLSSSENAQQSKYNSEHSSGYLKIGNLEIDREKFIASLNGEELSLPKKEFELLNLLVSKPEKVFSREEIFREVWGDNIIVGDRTIDVHIRKLREKIGDEHIKTVKGVGYKFTE